MPKVIRMQAKSQARKDGQNNDGTHLSRRGPRFVASTKGIRLRPDQILWLNGQLDVFPEDTWSSIAREGVDLVRAKREGRLQVLVPAG